MAEVFHPKSNDDVLTAVQWAVAEKKPLEILGTGSKQGLGKPVETEHTLELSSLSGVTLFEPEELVLGAKAGTPLSEIKALLDAQNQELQFEPADLGPLLGKDAGLGTIGGLVNTNICGPRRLKSGSVRDHILGVDAISGRGEMFKSGGRVVKNVTGYDLAKGVTGSYGTLAVLTDIVVKVLPKSETEQTLVLIGLSDADATSAMAAAMGSSAEVSGAAHIPAGLVDDKARTVLRLEGFAPSVKSRIEALSVRLKSFAAQERFEETDSKALWTDIRDCRLFHGSRETVWRISCTPSRGHDIVRMAAEDASIDHFYDWQGGLIWLLVKGGRARPNLIRRAVQKMGGGHATLIRADAATRQSIPVFQPQKGALAALSERYRANFDPHRLLNPGRMG